MTSTEITVPQLGEGLHEVLIREFLKKPGEQVRRDEPLYVMETDKATVEAQAPMDGTLLEWLAELNDTLRVGSPVARILSRENEPALESTHVSDAGPFTQSEGASENLSAEPQPSGYADFPLTAQQKALVFRLNRSSSVVSGNISRPVEWQRLKDAATKFSQGPVPLRASEFQLFAYCVAQASKLHPKLRSMWVTNGTVREYHHLSLGVAVARPNGELITAVVPEADRLELPDFIASLKRQILRAWKEGDQASATTQLILSYLGSYGVTSGVPTLVAPASGVLFCGAAYEQQNRLLANLSLTFDHRLINGVTAARFLARIDEEIDGLRIHSNSNMQKQKEL